MAATREPRAPRVPKPIDAIGALEWDRRTDTSYWSLATRTHVDDFGTGFSSISLLQDLPVTGMKLDIRFVRALTPTEESPANALAAGLSGLAAGLGLIGIAEGVETEDQAHLLRAQGWSHGQGWLNGRPAALP